MLFIFDLGNVLVDIDFNRVLGAWSHFSAKPLAALQQSFSMNKTFEQHERGEISDEAFATQFSADLDINLSFEQFELGWNAIFIGARQPTVEMMQKLRNAGHRVVILSNTNLLHAKFWLEEYESITAQADHVYLSHEMGMRKPELDIYRTVLQKEGFTAEQTVFFDDAEKNIIGANQLGIRSVLVKDSHTVLEFFQQNPQFLG